MIEERRMILEMLQQGAITVEEAERLMEAIPAEAEKPQSIALPGASGSRLAPKRFHVVVTEDGRTKVNVKIPFSLVRAGLRIGQTVGSFSAKYVNDAEETAVLESLRDIDIDEVLESISDGDIALPYVMVDVDTENKHVQVVLE